MYIQYLTIASKELIQSASLEIQQELGASFTLSDIRESIAQMLSGKEYSTLMNDIGLETALFKFSQVPEDDSRDFLVFKECEGLLPIWEVETFEEADFKGDFHIGKVFPQYGFIEADFNELVIRTGFWNKGGGEGADAFIDSQSESVTPALGLDEINNNLYSKTLLERIALVNKKGLYKEGKELFAFILDRNGGVKMFDDEDRFNLMKHDLN